MARKKKGPILESVERNVTYVDGVFTLVSRLSQITILSPDKDTFNAALEKLGYKPVRLTKNLMNPAAGDIVIDDDTPNYCDVGSEAYWSM